MRQALLVILALVPATAHAASVHVTTGASGHQTVRFTAKPGERNWVVVRFGTDDVEVTDQFSGVVAGPGCTQDGGHAARCPAAAVWLGLGDRDDKANVDCPETGLCGAVSEYGRAGDDDLEGNVQSETIDGGAGNDRVVGNGGRDVLRGGPGDDVVDGGYAEADYDPIPTISCGAGQDVMEFVAVIRRDCEYFQSQGFVWFGHLRFLGGRLKIALRHAKCPVEFRWGTANRWRRTTHHPLAWSYVVLPIPRTGGLTPHLYARDRCPDEHPLEFGDLLFRLRTGS